MEFDKLTIKNFKCFDDEGAVIDNLKLINVIIGKNNSGKSSLIELFQCLTNHDTRFFENKRNGKEPEILCEHIFRKELIGNSFPPDKTGGDIFMNHYAYGELFDKSIIKYSIQNYQKKFLSVSQEYKKGALNYFEAYVSNLKLPISRKQFRHLSAERDIKPERERSDKSNSIQNINSNGDGATYLVQQIISRDSEDSDLIEKTLLKELNQILNPDIEFSRILVQQNKDDVWEIYFENIHDGRVPLSKMGSGVKTILLVLILIHIIPALCHVSPSDFVFALEELENNLHPSLQRRLYIYLHEFSIKNKCILFLTTHSNIVIDLYSSLEKTQLFHINKIGSKTSVKSILQQVELTKILEDLDIRASDILQSNGIIWVEGPSDKIYLNKWINIIDPNLIEGNHFLIMFYGGRLLSNLTFKMEFLNTELIPLLKLNRNAYVVMDRDSKTISNKINDTKLRIKQELGEDSAWITDGREIENYLSDKTLNQWLLQKHNISNKIENDKFEKLENSIEKLPKASKIKYEKSKNKYAAEIVEYIEKSNMSEELTKNISKLISKIKQWNQLK